MNLDYDSVAFLDFHILIAQNITLGIMFNNISVTGVLAFQLWHPYKYYTSNILYCIRINMFITKYSELYKLYCVC